MFLIGLVSEAVLVWGASPPVAVQIREDLSLKRHGVLVAGAQAPAFRASLSQVSGQANIDSLTPVLGTGMVLTNSSTQPITHVTVRYIRLTRGTGDAVPNDIAFGISSIAQAVPNGGKLIIFPNSIRQAGSGSSVQSPGPDAARIQTMFDSNIFSSAYAYIDSVEFADGTVVGPDTWGYMAEAKARTQALAELREKVYDESLSDAQLDWWLQSRAKGEEWMISGGAQGGGVNHTAYQTQQTAQMALGGLQHSGREYVKVMVDKMLTFHNRVARIKEN